MNHLCIDVLPLPYLLRFGPLRCRKLQPLPAGCRAFWRGCRPESVDTKTASLPLHGFDRDPTTSRQHAIRDLPELFGDAFHCRVGSTHNIDSRDPYRSPREATPNAPRACLKAPRSLPNGATTPNTTDDFRPSSGFGDGIALVKLRKRILKLLTRDPDLFCQPLERFLVQTSNHPCPPFGSVQFAHGLSKFAWLSGAGVRDGCPVQDCLRGHASRELLPVQPNRAGRIERHHSRDRTAALPPHCD